VKIAGARADSFVGRPDPKIAAVLVYGPDRGLVRERAETLARAVVDDPADPFRAVDLGAADLKGDPARLGDEAAAISLGGGRRLVRVREANDGMAGLFSAFFAAAHAESALVVVEAGDLAKRSALRRAFEDAGNAAAVPCYADDARSLGAVIAETLGAHGLKAAPDALAFLAGNLGADRSVTRAELEKLALYMGGPGTVTLEDAAACVGDSAATSLDGAVFAAGAGDLTALEKALGRAFTEGVAPIALLRAANRHFQRLHWLRGQMAAGRSVEQAVAALRPPVLFLHADAIKAQARRWPADRLARVLSILLEAEIDCKTTGMPDVAVCARALLRIAQAGRAGRD
jgi:DNA polymerase-3 subunit delta